MRLSTRILGILGALLSLLGMVTHDWWNFSMGASFEVLALLWAIYEKE